MRHLIIPDINILHSTHSNHYFSSRQSNPGRKSSQGTPNTSRRGFDDKSAALRTVRDFMSTGSRNQSPVRSGDSSRNSPASSGAQTPAESHSLSPNPSSVTEDKMRKVTKSTAEEFFGCKDYKVSSISFRYPFYSNNS